MKRGWLISFEGPDGAGKSTQIRKIEELLEERKIPFRRSREPGGTPIGERLRDILLDRGNKAMTPRTEALLYAAARAQHVEEVIRPAMEAGITVICDRFTESSIAYQGYGRGLGPETIREMNEFATMGLRPNLTVLLLLDPEEGKRRVRESREPDRIEAEADAFHKKVYEGYRMMAEQEPDRMIAVDAAGDVDEIAKKIRERLLPFLEDADE